MRLPISGNRIRHFIVPEMIGGMAPAKGHDRSGKI